MKDTKQNTTGKVYLVGAGPSDPGLLTIKGLQVLQQAQVVIYDALIGPGIYSLIPPEAEKISVGKRAGQHSAKQEDISRLILDQARKGRTVVRLKGGDPFLFGRGGEELELLLEHQIPYEIVPGVTSAIAVPAYAGIPVTYRGISSGVHILTGHRKQDEPLEIDFEALLRAGGTYVFLMGVAALHEIVSGFLRAGMPPAMPAAVIAQGTGAGQVRVSAPLDQLEQEVRSRQIKTPAVIVIGQTAALGDRFAWREQLPLSQSCILVTRPASRSGKLAGMLRNLGAEVLEIPAIRTKARDCTDRLSEVLAVIDSYDFMVFTSPAGVEHFFALLDQMELDIRCIGRIKLAVIGSATGDALKKRGLRPELMPDRYNSIQLGRLLGRSVPAGGKVLLLRSAQGSAQLVRQIQSEQQIEVTDLAIYDTVDTCEPDRDGNGPYLHTLFRDGRIEMVMFTSASTVRGFVKMTEGMDHTKVRALCIGQMTAEQASAYGMQVYLSEKETVESMVEAAVQLHGKLLSGNRDIDQSKRSGNDGLTVV